MSNRPHPPITRDRLADLLGDGWTLIGSMGRMHTFRLPLREATVDHVYCYAKLNPKTATISYGLEHDAELIAVVGSMLGDRWLTWQSKLRHENERLWGPRTYAARGPVYGIWNHCPPALVEAVVIPTIATLADVARLAVRRIVETPWWLLPASPATWKATQ